MQRVFCSFLFTTLIAVTAFSSPLTPLATIDGQVKTDFGIYEPYEVDIVPSALSYAIDPKFNNVRNFNDFDFSSEEKRLLRENGFVAVPSQYLEMYDVYNQARKQNLPIFVTSDAMLHTYHELYDYILRVVETESFIPDLVALTHELLEGSQEQFSHVSHTDLQLAAKKNIAYFAVAAKLLDPDFSIPPSVSEWVRQDLDSIDNHQGFAFSSIFGYKEDFSQYVPRGHYTLSQELKRYFRAMMWYGRMIFHCEEGAYLGESQITPDMVDEMTRRALMIAQLLNQADPQYKQMWEKIYATTQFFVGEADDLGFPEYEQVAQSVYGDGYADASAGIVADREKLAQAIATLKNDYPRPKINPEGLRGFKFMGQRFIPDSYMFYKLVYPNTSQFFPRGLDVMAILGSDRAYEIIDTVYQDTKDEALVSQLNMLKQEFAGMEEDIWAKNLYWNWLYSLMPLLEEKSEGFPFFMQNQAWADKDLATALGSWAELRHDTILYAKQSYSLRGMTPAFKYGMEYVEPNPWVFARLASLANYMIEGLKGFNLLHNDFASRLQTFHSTALILKEAAERELLNQPLTTQQKWAIRNIGPTLMEMTTFYDGQSMGQAVDEPDSMAVIADVHTDINSGKVLEVGVGYPLNLYVIVGAGDNLNVMVGSAFSYYEFKHPMDDRLTDEAWNEILEKGAQPVQEPWMDSYLIADRSFDRSTNPFFDPKKIMEGISIEWVAQFGNTFIFRVDIANLPSYQREKFRNASPQLELTVGDKIFTHSLQPDTTTANPHDYTAQFRVDASGKQKIEATVFSRQNLDIFHHTQFQPQQNSSFGSAWLLFE